MKNTSKQIDRKILKTLEPLDRLNPILIDELAAKSIIEEVPADKIICRHGEKDSRQIYLLSGQIEVVTPGETKTKLIKTKSPLKTPIAEGSPRKQTLKTKKSSTLLYIDSDLLELLMSDEPELSPTYEVTEITADDSDDWMLTFLQSPAFLQLPTENIQKLLTHMEEIPAKKDQVVIQQGAKDDNYYIIKSGSCSVNRQPYEGSASVLLAVLPTGSGFGEEALISNGTRNATITMRENGTLMRLKKKDFLTLLINPLIPYFEHAQTQEKLDQGCVVIDVRSEEESKKKPLEGAVNVPLSMLRVKFDSLNAEREYLLVCNDGSQSAAAAFLMIQGGFKCCVLKNGMASSKPVSASKKPAAKINTAASAKAQKQVDVAKAQSLQIAQQQEQIKSAREKADRDIIKHKKELAESRARIAQKKKVAPATATPSTSQAEMTSLKQKAAQELAKAQAENKAIEVRQQETAKTVQRAEEMIKQSTMAAEQTRKQAEKEAAVIKQRALEEAQKLRAEKEQAEQAKNQAEEAAALIKQRALEASEQQRVEKAAEELARAQAEKESIELRQKETNAAMLQAEEMIKQSAANVEQARKQAEEEATLIKQRAIEEADYLRAEVAAARIKMEEDAARIKEEEKLIKDNALKMRHEADEIRKEAMNEAQQVRAEIEETRSLLNQKLQQTQDEEKRKHDAILAEAKVQADQLAKTKTQQASIEAEAIRQKANDDALHLHNELEQTRKQIEAEATKVINDLKEQANNTEQKVRVIEEEVLVEIVAQESTPIVAKDAPLNFKSVNIPGMSDIAPIADDEAQRKAIAIKEKLAQSQKFKASQQAAAANAKIHQTNKGTILEGEEDLFIFQQPKTPSNATSAKVEQAPVVAQRTKVESALTQISIEPEQKSVVIYPQQDQGSAYENNPFLNQDQEAPHTATSYNTPQFDMQAHAKRVNASKSNAFAIAASFILILAGAIFTLHATNTLKVQTIASLFNSGNDTVQATTAVAKVKEKTIRRKVLRADTKVNVKKKVTSQVDNIMSGWKDVLSEAENPKKLQDNK